MSDDYEDDDYNRNDDYDADGLCLECQNWAGKGQRICKRCADEWLAQSTIDLLEALKALLAIGLATDSDSQHRAREAAIRAMTRAERNIARSRGDVAPSPRRAVR
jgi:hypothetical protein